MGRTLAPPAPLDWFLVRLQPPPLAESIPSGRSGQVAPFRKLCAASSSFFPKTKLAIGIRVDQILLNVPFLYYIMFAFSCFLTRD